MKNKERPVGVQSSKIGCLAVPLDSQSSSELATKIMYFLEKTIGTDQATAIKIFKYADARISSSFNMGPGN